jgi:hypothetical protein
MSPVPYAIWEDMCHRYDRRGILYMLQYIPPWPGDITVDVPRDRVLCAPEGSGEMVAIPVEAIYPGIVKRRDAERMGIKVAPLPPREPIQSLAPEPERAFSGGMGGGWGGGSRQMPRREDSVKAPRKLDPQQILMNHQWLVLPVNSPEMTQDELSCVQKILYNASWHVREPRWPAGHSVDVLIERGMIA